MTLRLLATVALTRDLPDLNLHRGQVGTIVEEWAPGVYEVEFADTDGRTYAMTAVPADALLALRYEPESAA
jgi:hypothetical protein